MLDSEGPLRFYGRRILDRAQESHIVHGRYGCIRVERRYYTVSWTHVGDCDVVGGSLDVAHVNSHVSATVVKIDSTFTNNKCALLHREPSLYHVVLTLGCESAMATGVADFLIDEAIYLNFLPVCGIPAAIQRLCSPRSPRMLQSKHSRIRP